MDIPYFLQNKRDALAGLKLPEMISCSYASSWDECC